jgi:hypothetical protein
MTDNGTAIEADVVTKLSQQSVADALVASR